MQIDRKLYNPVEHDKYRALTVRQPWADLLTVAVFRDDDGNYHAEKSIEIRSRNTKYRGDVLICSSAQPSDLKGHLFGVTCGFVELYDVKRVEDFTEQDWDEACFLGHQRPRKGYGWMLRNPRRVVEMSVKGQCGFYDIVVPKGDMTEYPREMAFGDDGWIMVQSKIRK